MGAVATWIDQTFIQPARFFFTGEYSGTEGNDSIVAVNIFGNWSGGEAKIYAGGGNDDIYLASIATTAYTGTGDDRIFGIAASMTVRDDWGNLEIYGAGGAFNVYKNGDGWIYVGAAAAYANLDSRGNGDVTFSGAAGYTNVTKVGNGNINFNGLAGGTRVYQSGGGDVNFFGAAGSNNVEKYGDGTIRFFGAAGGISVFQRGYGDIWVNGAAGWANVRKEGYGNISFNGAAGGVSLSQSGDGDIYFAGAGGGVNVNKNGNGHISLYGAAASTNINQTGAGNINFGGVGAHAQINKTGATGDVTIQGGVGNVNVNYRQGSGNIVFQGTAGNVNLTQDSGSIVMQGAVGAATVAKYNNGNIEFRGAVAGANISQNGSGNISFAGAAGGARVAQTGSGNIYFAGAGGAVDVNKTGDGQIDVYGATANTNIAQNGAGNINFGGVAANAQINKAAQTHIQETVTTTVWETVTFSFWGYVFQWQTPVTRTETRWVDRTTGDVVLQGGVGNVNVNYAQGNGNIIFQGAAGNVNLTHAKGDIILYGAVGGATVNKSGDGNIDFKGVAGYINLNHTGENGTVSINGAAAYSKVVRSSSNSNSRNNDIYFYGAGAYSNVMQQASGNIDFRGTGAANVLTHTGAYGTTSFAGAGAANIITHGAQGDVNFNGAGVANVITHKGVKGNTNFNGAGGANVIVHSAQGDVNFNGDGMANIITHKGAKGSTHFNGAGGANVIVHSAQGDVDFNGVGMANVIVHTGSVGNATVNAGGALNLVVRQGQGNLNETMAALGNISVHVGNGNDRILQLGGLNTHTRVGDGDTVLGLAGGLNVATLVGNGAVYGGLLGVGNVVTKVGTGTMYLAAVGSGNVVSHIDTSNRSSLTAAILIRGANILTKYGQGDLYGLMAGGFNVATHIGTGNDYMAQAGGANIMTKVGQGSLMAAQFGAGNILTHVGDGTSLGLMAGGGNVYTKVGNGLSAGLMLGGTANVYTHVGSGDSFAVMAGQGGNLFTKVDVNSTPQSTDITAAAMLGTGNVFTHVGSGTTGALMLAGGNLFTKVGDGNTAAAMVGVGNIATHVGNGTLFAVMGGVPVGIPSGNVLTKVGNGTTVGVMAASGNLFTHIGDGNTTGIVMGEANIITKVGHGDQVDAVLGKANVLTHVTLDGGQGTVGSNNSYNLAVGTGNIITKVGDGKQVSALVGKGNIVTHVGDGDAINLSVGGMANLITKVGDGNTVTGIFNSKVNVVTHVGDGNDYQGIWGQANIVTKVGDGTSASAMKGSANVITAVGDGAQVGLLAGDLNVVTKVGDGVSVNLIKGKGNINTKVGDGASVAVMMGTGNANIQVGDGTMAFVAYANNNISIKVGDGDYYGFAFAKGKATVLQNAKAVGRSVLQSAAGFVGSGVISQLIWGAEDTGHGDSAEADVTASVLAEPTTTEPTFDFAEHQSMPVFKSKSSDVQVSEPGANSNLSRDNIESINSSQQNQDVEASRAGAKAAEQSIKGGIDNSRADVNSLFSALENVVGDGGVLQSTLNTVTTALVDRLSTLDHYVGELDESLKTRHSSNHNGEFANGLISNVNTQLDSTLQSADEALSQSEDAVGDARLHIEKVKQDAQTRQNVAADAKGDALLAQQSANLQKTAAENRATSTQTQANTQVNAAQTRVNGVNSNATGAKLTDADKPGGRTAATGSGLTGSAAALDAIDPFTGKSDAELDKTAVAIVGGSQQAVLHSGVSGVTIAPQVLGGHLPGEQAVEEDDEDDDEGGLTDEQIAALHAAESANNNLGLRHVILLDTGVGSGVQRFNNENFRGSGARANPYDKVFTTQDSGWTFKHSEVIETDTGGKTIISAEGGLETALQARIVAILQAGGIDINNPPLDQVKIARNQAITEAVSALEEQRKISDHLSVVSEFEQGGETIKTGVFNIQTLGHKKLGAAQIEAIANTIGNSGADIMSILEVMGKDNGVARAANRILNISQLQPGRVTAAQRARLINGVGVQALIDTFGEIDDKTKQQMLDDPQGVIKQLTPEEKATFDKNLGIFEDYFNTEVLQLKQGNKVDIETVLHKAIYGAVLERSNPNLTAAEREEIVNKFFEVKDNLLAASSNDYKIRARILTDYPALDGIGLLHDAMTLAANNYIPQQNILAAAADAKKFLDNIKDDAQKNAFLSMTDAAYEAQYSSSKIKSFIDQYRNALAVKQTQKSNDTGLEKLEEVVARLNLNSNTKWAIAYAQNPDGTPSYSGMGLGGPEMAAFIYKKTVNGIDYITLNNTEKGAVPGVGRQPVLGQFTLHGANDVNVNVVAFHPKSPENPAKNAAEWIAFHDYMRVKGIDAIIGADTNIEGTDVASFVNRGFAISQIIPVDEQKKIILASRTDTDMEVDLTTDQLVKTEFNRLFNANDVKLLDGIEGYFSSESVHTSLGTAEKYGNLLKAVKFNNITFGPDDTELDRSKRTHIHNLIGDGKDTLLSATDSRYQLVKAEGDFVVYKFTVDGKVSYRVVNTASDYSIYMSKAPTLVDGKLHLDGMTAKVFAHGSPTGQTYTAEDGSPRQAYYAPDGRNLISNPSALVDDPTQPYTEGQRQNYTLGKTRNEFLGDGYSVRHLDETMHATVGALADNQIIVTPGKYSTLDSRTLDHHLAQYGVTDSQMHICRGDEGSAVYRHPLSNKAQTAADSIIDATFKNIHARATTSPSIAERFLKYTSDLDRTINGAVNPYYDQALGQYIDTKLAAITDKAETVGKAIVRRASTLKPQITMPGQSRLGISTNGNVQLQVGDGEYTAGFWGNTNLGIKLGDGGFKTLAFGNNNVMIHIGDGDNAQRTVKVSDYTAFESIQVFVGERNLSYNQGRSNDFIVMLDKAIPLAPFQSPLNGPSDIVGFLKNDIAKFDLSGFNQATATTAAQQGDATQSVTGFYQAQSFLWSSGNAKKIIDQISALDMNSAVEYDTLFDYGAEKDRSDRALKADLERKANAMFNQALAGQSPLSAAKNRNIKDQNFNITVAGQGSDIVIANGDNQFMFGDNAQSIMDTTVASLFGILSQDVGRNGQVSNPLSVSGGKNAKDAFLNTLKNLAQDTFSRVMARTAAGLPDMSFGEAFGLDYKADGQLIVETANGDAGVPSAQQLVGYAEDGMHGMMDVLGNFGNANLGSYLNSSRLVDTLRTALDKGPEALAEFRDTLLGVETPADETADTEAPAAPEDTNTQPPATGAPAQPAVPTMKSSEVFGFGALKLPSIFDFDISAGFSAIPDMLNNLVGTLDSFDGDINTMKAQMFDFFSKSGYMQGDGDLMLSLGNNNFAWGGDGADIAAFMGLNNNFWGGRGDDMYYGIGENNQASGNDGNDTAILLGINNIFFGGDGKDFALASGRNGNLAGGDGDDTLYALGDTSWLNGGAGNDYLVAVGNYNGIDGGEGNDFAVSIGNFADVDLGAGHDVVSIFGNAGSIKTGAGDDLLRLMGHKSQLYAGEGSDFIWAESDARDNTVEGNAGNDTFVLGGDGNVFRGGEGRDTFVINDGIINVHVADIDQNDQVVFSAMSFDQIWFTRSNTDLTINLDNELGSVVTLTNYFGQAQQADIVVGTLASTADGQPRYEVLSADALNQLVQVMAGYDITGEEAGFMSGVSAQDQQIIATAWDKTLVKSGLTTPFV